MKNINIPVVIFGSILIIALSGCASVIQSGNKGMIWSPWGKGLKTNKVYDDGVVWKWPWNSIISYNIQWKKYQIKVPLLTKDELHVTITVSVIMRPDPEDLIPMELEIGKGYYKNVVEPKFFTITRNVFANFTHKEMSLKGPEIEQKILTELRSNLVGKHIELDNVTLEHLMYSPLVTRAVDRKLATQQAIEQKDYEIEIALKNAEIQRILAKGQKDAQRIISSELNKLYLQYRALEVQEKLSLSPNAKFYFVPIGKDGIPIIIDANEK